MDYLLEAAPAKEAEGDAGVAKPACTGTLVYCIDISGSMASTTQVSSLQCKHMQALLSQCRVTSVRIVASLHNSL